MKQVLAIESLHPVAISKMAFQYLGWKRDGSPKLHRKDTYLTYLAASVGGSGE